MRILILCTGNSCRSQMAEGFLKSFDSRLKVYSAGTNPAASANPNAIAAMKEAGIDISGKRPKNVEIFLSDSFDYVITVCDHANETCPHFSGQVRHRLHMGFEDPFEAGGTKEEVMSVYRRVRDEIREGFLNFYREIKPEIDKEAEGIQETIIGDSGGNNDDCNCGGDCCQPKKKSIWPKVIFTLVMLAAMGVIVVKLFFTSSPVTSTPVKNSQIVNDQNSPKWADSCKSASGCDTTKGSSCCPKN